MIVTVSKAKKCIMETVKIETSTFPVCDSSDVGRCHFTSSEM
jgi:hypothetical protein